VIDHDGGLQVIHLDVPAQPKHIRLVRLLAAGLASQLDFSYDEVEDLRIAVDELCFLLVGPDGHAGRIEVAFTLGEDSVEVVGSADADGHDVSVGEFSQRILAAVTDRYELSRRDGGVTFRMIRRRHRS